MRIRVVLIALVAFLSLLFSETDLRAGVAPSKRQTLRLLSYQQFKDLNHGERVVYVKALRNFLVQMERRQPPLASNHEFIFDMLVASSEAASPDKSCVIAGFISTRTSGLCKIENVKDIQEMVNFCRASNGVPCNPAVFG